MGSLRLRLTALATTFVVAVLVAGAGSLFVLQRGQLTDTVDRSLRERADTVESLFIVSDLPESFTADDDDRGVQVVSEDGQVAIASDNLEGEGPVAELDASTREVIRTVDDFPLGDDGFRVLSRRIETDAGVFVLHIAESTDDLDDTTESLFTTLGFVVPALSLLFAGMTWFLVGRTLRPVDAMRADVDSIDDTRVRHRVAHPGRDDEIGRLARTLNLMLDRLHRSGEQQRQFVADAAHELRTPLTRIRTTVEVDLAQPDAAVPDRTNTEVRDEAIGLQRLIDDLLHLARSDDGEASLIRSPLDFDDLVMAEIQEQRRSTPSVSIDATAVSGCELDGDEAQVRRAVQNLLANAARHAASEVTVTLQSDASEVHLIVDDDGPGIEPDNRELIFDRFTRLDEARSSDSGGAGLGLAITRDIVTRHGGTIHCEKSSFGGARFVATFPVSSGE